VYKSKDIQEIDSATQQLNEAWADASEELYKAQQEAASQEAAPEETAAPDDQESDVKDVDYEVVEDDGAEK
jgi:molecular chaperone DnaK